MKHIIILYSEMAWQIQARKIYFEQIWVLGAFSIGNTDHMRTEKTPLRKCFLSAQGQPLSLFFPIIKLFSISVKAEARAPTEVNRAFHLPGKGTTWEGWNDESRGGAEPF